MKELKTHIFGGFFSNIGANNRIKLAIDTIKDVSLNNDISSIDKGRKFTKLLTSILEDVEADIKKGKFIFKYNRNDGSCIPQEIIISLEMPGPNAAKWAYSSKIGEFGGWSADDVASGITSDLFDEACQPAEDPQFYHSIAKTIKIVEIKLS